MKAIAYFAPFIEALLLTAIAVIVVFPTYIVWILLPIAALLALKVIQIRNSIAEEHLRVKVQLDQLYRLALTSVPDLRCTYYVPVRQGNLQQTCDYIPNGGGAGRKFPNWKGIIGKTYSDKCPQHVDFTDEINFRSRMISEFKYTQEELKSRTPDRRSYYCYPIVDDNNKVLGLAYFDSSIFKAFSNDVVNIINRSCLVIKDSLL
jgi:hypothetical protein